MQRTKFFQKVRVKSIDQLDHLHNNLSKFQMGYEPSYYRVDSVDLMRPDMISYTVYGTVDYWWIILLVNEIMDAFNDLEVGMLLTIPNTLDVANFFQQYRIR
jgi:hypothetical protein